MNGQPAPEGATVRVTAEMGNAMHLMAYRPSEEYGEPPERVPYVTWYEYPSGRYCVLVTEEEGRALRPGEGGIESIERTARGYAFCVHEPDGTYLMDTRTGKVYNPCEEQP